MSRRACVLILVSFMTLGCGVLGSGQPAATPLPELSLDTLQNAAYHSPDWGDFQLVQGSFYRTPLNPLESPEVYATRLRELVAHGDLDADGVPDAVVFLSTQNGGTGHFVELAALINRNGAAENVSTLGLGDRVAIESARVEAGTIILDMRVHAPGDGLCCPSQLETWTFKLVDGQLVRIP